MHEADLRSAILSDADLHGAYLVSANLRNADLSGADLRDADLRYADLSGANLSSADLSGSNLHGADLFGILFSSDTKWPPDYESDADRSGMMTAVVPTAMVTKTAVATQTVMVIPAVTAIPAATAITGVTAAQTVMALPAATALPVATTIPTATAMPVATAMPAATADPTPMAMPTATDIPTATVTPADTTTVPGVNHLGTEKVVLADYMMWYDPSSFDGNITWDVPSAGAYNSDDPATIKRHVQLAQYACLDGLAAHWYGPNDARTTNNFNQLLDASAGTGLRHAVVILTNILPGISEHDVLNASRHALDNWAQGPNYLRLGGRPVLIFSDMPRPWGSDAVALAGWARIRNEVDPGHNSIWFAEGLTTTYNPLFDGLYVYRIDHAQFPKSWLKQPRWRNALRGVEAQGNLPLGGLYFADTIAPGFDDTLSVNAPIDLRTSTEAFGRDRRDGEYYAETYSVISETEGDMLLVKSLNEWIEGTEIEPGVTYGDQYVTQTCQYANDYRTR